MPTVFADGQSVWLSYFVSHRRRDTVPDERVVVKFTLVDSVTFGGPNDETLNGHRLYDRGLDGYEFHEVIGSRWIKARERENSVHDMHQPELFARLRHFIFTFHDETFECLADDFVSTRRGRMRSVHCWTTSRHRARITV